MELPDNVDVVFIGSMVRPAIWRIRRWLTLIQSAIATGDEEGFARDPVGVR